MNTKISIFILLFLGSLQLVSQKDCNTTNKGLIPLPDLGTNYYRGYRGGLFPNGSNSIHSNHLNELNTLTQTFTTLDTSGMFSNNGKLVMIGVGASNPRTEFNRFMSYCDTFKNLNPKLKIINTCIGGQGIQKINSVTDNYWVSAYKNLEDSGLSYKQVQVAWVEIDNTQNGDTTFPGAPLGLVNDYKALFEVMLIKFPNLKVCYLSARGYAGYALPIAGGVGKGLLYPRDYLSGWANKFFIENEINNISGFNYKGINKNIPLVTWGSYHWSDGESIRNDGFALKCDSDIGGDGLHLTEQGEWKIGKQIFDFFSTNIATKSWFLKEAVSNGIDEINNDNVFKLYPNPNHFTEMNILENFIEEGENYSLEIKDLAGRIIALQTSTKNNQISFDCTYYPQGIYLAYLSSKEFNRVIRFVVQ